MIRHGETEANKARIMAGSLDSPLTDIGRKQAENVRDIIKVIDIKPKSIIHSHLSRSRDTANIINDALNVEMLEDQDIAELYAGDWEGVSYDICQQIFTNYDTPPNGESFVDFFKRIKRCHIRHMDKDNDPILIVSHGGVLRGLGGIYGLKTPGVFKNCHLYEFKPNTKNQTFPWDVWAHDEPKLKTKSTIFHDSKKFKQPLI